MTAANKATFLAALRSGEYEQAQRSLHTEGTFCCLGVALKVLKDWHPIVAQEWCFEESNTCSWEVTLDRLGIPAPLRSQMISLNDLLGYTFPMIADWVEANVPVTAQ